MLENNFVLCASLTILIQLLFCVISVCLHTDRLFDLVGGSNFVILALVTYFLGYEENLDERRLLITICVCLWGIRISTYLFYRILTVGSDHRFDQIRNNALIFPIIWFLQALWVYVGSLPVLLVNLTKYTPTPISSLDILGLAFFVFGFGIEVSADSQKFAFRQNEKNVKRWCDEGLWKYSRHPNYFGEMLLWWGIFLLSLSTLESHRWYAILSPLLTMVILLFATGIPPLESVSNKKYMDNEEYKKYRDSTSPLVPLPPKLYVKLPDIVKVVFFCEYPFYGSPSRIKSH